MRAAGEGSGVGVGGSAAALVGSAEEDGMTWVNQGFVPVIPGSRGISACGRPPCGEWRPAAAQGAVRPSVS
ncbi:hypothetical protein GCM10018791_72420 [Streptomyces zaomyceticus]|nr:hypothetical protein GCM10018791_72420 [Streptomyces zaomyceticus]